MWLLLDLVRVVLAVVGLCFSLLVFAPLIGYGYSKLGKILGFLGSLLNLSCLRSFSTILRILLLEGALALSHLKVAESLCTHCASLILPLFVPTCPLLCIPSGLQFCCGFGFSMFCKSPLEFYIKVLAFTLSLFPSSSYI